MTIFELGQCAHCNSASDRFRALGVHSYVFDFISYKLQYQV